MLNKIEEIDHFPYKSFKELKKNFSDGLFTLGVRKGLAYDCINKVLYHPKKTVRLCSLLNFVPITTVSIFLLYCIINLKWWYLLGVPVLILGFLASLPTATWLPTYIKKTFIILAIFLSIIGIYYKLEWLWMISLILLINWKSLEYSYELAFRSILNISLTTEEIFCSLWTNKLISLHFSNGTIYFRDFKRLPDGSTETYSPGILRNEEDELMSQTSLIKSLETLTLEKLQANNNELMNLSIVFLKNVILLRNEIESVRGHLELSPDEIELLCKLLNLLTGVTCSEEDLLNLFKYSQLEMLNSAENPTTTEANNHYDRAALLLECLFSVMIAYGKVDRNGYHFLLDLGESFGFSELEAKSFLERASQNYHSLL